MKGGWIKVTQELRFKNLEHYGFGPNVMKNTKVCPNCGRMVGAKNRTCPECQKRLSRETLFDQYKRQHLCCPDCDTVLAPDSMYCPNCGKAVSHKENAVLVAEQENA